MIIIHQLFSLARDWSKRVTWANIPQLELGNIRGYNPPINFRGAISLATLRHVLDSYLTIILRNRAEYRLILSRRGRRPSRLKSDDIPRD